MSLAVTYNRTTIPGDFDISNVCNCDGVHAEQDTAVCPQCGRGRIAHADNIRHEAERAIDEMLTHQARHIHAMQLAGGLLGRGPALFVMRFNSLQDLHNRGVTSTMAELVCDIVQEFPQLASIQQLLSAPDYDVMTNIFVAVVINVSTTQSIVACRNNTVAYTLNGAPCRLANPQLVTAEPVTSNSSSTSTNHTVGCCTHESKNQKKRREYRDSRK